MASHKTLGIIPSSPDCLGKRLADDLGVKADFVSVSPELRYTVEVRNAIITSMRNQVPVCLDPTNKTMGHMEEVSFTYETIVETFTLA